MRIATICLVAGLLPAAALAQTCDRGAIHCNGRWVSLPCDASAAETKAACENGTAITSTGSGSGSGSGSGEATITVMYELVNGTVQLFEDVHAEQVAAFAREKSDRRSEVAGKLPSVSCVLLLDGVTESTEAFEKEGEDFANSFAKGEYEKTIDKLRDQHKSKSKHEKAYEAFQAWREKIEAWSKDLREWETCLRTPGCKLIDLASKDKKQIQKWLAKMGWVDEDAADRVDRAADFLEGYTKRIAETNLAYAQKAAACSAR